MLRLPSPAVGGPTSAEHDAVAFGRCYTPTVLTLGIDLSTSPARTAAFFLDWTEQGPTDRGIAPYRGLDESALLDLMSQADRVAIDAPFGWPEDFVDAVSGWRARDSWTEHARPALRFRATDRFVKDHARAPLSVSSDRIASTAMLCADLLATHCTARDEPLDRVAGHAVEAYPAAALVAWGLSVKGYKAREATAVRRALLDSLANVARLQLCPLTVSTCVETDHALDALVCALVARAAACPGLTHQVPEDVERAARREGWIQLPTASSLEALALGRSKLG